jgi:hypothetical protein
MTDNTALHFSSTQHLNSQKVHQHFRGTRLYSMLQGKRTESDTIINTRCKVAQWAAKRTRMAENGGKVKCFSVSLGANLTVCLESRS